MQASIKYCLIAIVCTLILAAAYITINRYDCSTDSTIIVRMDRITGKTIWAATLNSKGTGWQQIPTKQQRTLTPAQ